jgi:hypothetical protein
MGGQSFFEYVPMKDTLPPMVEAKSNEDLLNIIIRDDRVDDTGIYDFQLVSSTGIEVIVPKIEPGLPQMSIKAKPINLQGSGKLQFMIRDVALNQAIYTVCYTFNPRSGKFLFSFQEGLEADCVIEPGFIVGLFGRMSAVMHKADFSSTNGIIAEGGFSDAFGFGGYGGALASRQITEKLFLTARLSIASYEGLLSAPDTTVIRIRDGDEFQNYQEAKEFQLNGMFLHLSIGGEWYFKPYIYACAGIDLGFALSDKINYRRRILQPVNVSFEGGKREIATEEKLKSMVALRYGLFGGIGFSYPLTHRISVFSESLFFYHFNSLIDDGNWYINQLVLNIGFKYLI